LFTAFSWQNKKSNPKLVWTLGRGKREIGRRNDKNLNEVDAFYRSKYHRILKYATVAKKLGVCADSYSSSVSSSDDSDFDASYVTSSSIGSSYTDDDMITEEEIGSSYPDMLSKSLAREALDLSSSSDEALQPSPVFHKTLCEHESLPARELDDPEYVGPPLYFPVTSSSDNEVLDKPNDTEDKGGLKEEIEYVMRRYGDQNSDLSKEEVNDSEIDEFIKSYDDT
jgi:hypothetical protein